MHPLAFSELLKYFAMAAAGARCGLHLTSSRLLPRAVTTGGNDESSRTVAVSVPLEHLEACELRADVQERQLRLLQKQIDETDAALKLELARGEKHAEAPPSPNWRTLRLQRIPVSER
jgi:hypothetical protein